MVLPPSSRFACVGAQLWLWLWASQHWHIPLGTSQPCPFPSALFSAVLDISLALPYGHVGINPEFCSPPLVCSEETTAQQAEGAKSVRRRGGTAAGSRGSESQTCSSCSRVVSLNPEWGCTFADATWFGGSSQAGLGRGNRCLMSCD